MKIFYLIIAIFFFTSCTKQQKKFSNVSVGMTQEKVLQNAGEPSSKKKLGSVEIWVYKSADRTVVFKNDTVLNVITSAEARVDSIEMSLKEAGKDIKKEAEKATEKIDSMGKKLKNKMSKDSIKP